MEQIPNISFHEVIVFFIILVRVSTIVVTVPILGYQAIPTQVKAGLSLLLSLLLYPVIDQGNLRIPLELLPFMVMVANEVLIGLIIGFVMGIIFSGIRLAGAIIGMDMGFGIVNVIDPQTGVQVSIIGQFKYIVALLLFLTMDGHHFILRILKLSYEAVPMTGDNFSPAAVSEIVRMSGQIFTVALQVSAAALASLFIATVLMGIIARLVPQMNIFIVGFPLKISVGLIMLFVSLPFFLYIFGKLYHVFERDVVRILEIV